MSGRRIMTFETQHVSISFHTTGTSYVKNNFKNVGRVKLCQRRIIIHFVDRVTEKWKIQNVKNDCITIGHNHYL